MCCSRLGVLKWYKGYNYSFVDAVKDLSKKSGVSIEFNNPKKNYQDNKTIEILEISCDWFQQNLSDKKASICNKYLESRNLSKDTIKKFRLGYSFNSKTNLYEYLKNKLFTDDEIIKSNIVKVDKNKVHDINILYVCLYMVHLSTDPLEIY